ncbi:HEAT repeat domain-containing protein [Nocardia heshunensis]
MSDSAGEWRTWRLAVFGDPYLVWHDGADFRQLLELARSDREAVGRMLALGLGEADSLAADSLRMLNAEGLAPARSRELLLSAASRAVDEFLLTVAHALYSLTDDEAWLDPIVGLLATAGPWTTRMDAARALADVRATPQVLAALRHALDDTEFLVRYHAANTLAELVFSAENQ